MFKHMNPIRQLREFAGVTQRQLADLAGTSQSTIAAYEGGSKSPTWRTLAKLVDAVGCALHVQCVPPLTREDRRSLALHAAVATRLRADPQAVRAHARESLARMRSLHPGARPLLDEWRLLLRRPLDALVLTLVDPSARSRELRQVTPFSGILSARERADMYRAFAHTERSHHADSLHAKTRAA